MRREPDDMYEATAAERTERHIRRSLVTLLKGQTALLKRAEFKVESGDEGAVPERDRLMKAVQSTAAEIDERAGTDRVRAAYRAYADRVRR